MMDVSSTTQQTGSTNVSRFTPAPKSRSCVVCRSRKVKCDKTNPCSNCRRTNVACVYPAADRPPKWARRLERITKEAATNPTADESQDENVEQVMSRLRSLEGLVKELSGQLEHANSRTPSVRDGASNAASPGGSDHGHTGLTRASDGTTSRNGHEQGRLLVQDKNRSRYLSSGFWSRMNDELDSLKIATQGMQGHDSDSSDEDSSARTATTQELGRAPTERHGFIFRQNLGAPSLDLREFNPLPSQIPFLLDTFAENVNYIAGILHMPTIRKLVRGMRGSDASGMSPANEALLFSIYYSAVTSMEDDDVINNFGTTKAELNLKFRLGLEHALAKADFLNVPDLVVVQAFTNFLLLARRYDSPRFIWMMTGLLVRMAHSLGLQRDGSNFQDLTPFEVEMRRRVWWAICMLDIRASEDQGTELTIARDSFDTKLPGNIHDADLSPESRISAPISDGLTEVTAAHISYQIIEGVREMVATGGKTDPPPPEVQSRLIDELGEKLNVEYLIKESNYSAYWMALTCGKLVMAKMRLLIYLPILFNSPSEHFSEDIRNKLLISAIEVAEYNHILNAEQSVRQWRWIYQVYTHWYSIVYMLLEVARRPLSPTVERAWIALQSVWLIPAKSQLDKSNQHWIPLRKLMARARDHREKELARLRANPQAIYSPEEEDRSLPSPGSTGPFSEGNSSESYLNHWRDLISVPNLSMRTADHQSSPTELTTTPSSWSTASVPRADTGVTHATYNEPSVAQQSSNVIPVDWMTHQSNNMDPSQLVWNDINFSMDDLGDFDPNFDLTNDIDWQVWLNTSKDLV